MQMSAKNENNIKKVLEKIVINSGIGKLSQSDSFKNKILPEIIKEFSYIVGQKPATRPARKSIAGFKVRQGTIVGLKATLRGKRMADFFKKVISAVLPRVRDFRGVSDKSIDEGGNLTIGIKDHTIFPEINAESSNVDFGLQITIVPKETKNKKDAKKMYQELGIPFKKP